MKQALRREMKKRVRDFVERPLYLPVGIEMVYLPVGIQTIFTFLSTPHEIDTSPLIRYALASGMTVAAPRIHGASLAFHALASADGPFATGPYGLKEPSGTAPRLFPPSGPGCEPHFPLLVLVPGLAFSRSGHRIGRGGGYYDRFLSSLLAAYPDKRHLITIAGAAWSFQIVDSVPVEKHDIAVDCLYTEKGCILCI